MARGYDNDNNRPVHHVVLEGRQAGSYGKRPEDNPYDRKTQPAQFGMWQIRLIQGTPGIRCSALTEISLSKHHLNISTR